MLFFYTFLLNAGFLLSVRSSRALDAVFFSLLCNCARICVGGVGAVCVCVEEV